MKITPRRDYMLSLESVAMTDIVLNMFIFFFISFSLLYTFSKSPGIKVTLPTAKTATPQKENITVFISSGNEIFLDNRKVNVDELRGILKERLDTSRKKIVILKSDEKVNLGLAVKVMDIAKQAEAEGVIISTTIEENAKR
ncbi:MAG: biopolymer transporter ExbD [Candidatus Omnitrophota bacterium]|nr:biopolymer transporter ExbD [Candidatus Omnitrophota bacterium]